VRCFSLGKIDRDKAGVVEGFEDEVGVALDLKESSSVVDGCGDEIRAWLGGAARDRHAAIVKRILVAKVAFASNCCGTAEAVPLSKAFELKLE
jgi:hypothetical protein